MVMSACMLVVVYGERPLGYKDDVLLRGERLQYTGCGVVG